MDSLKKSLMVASAALAACTFAVADNVTMYTPPDFQVLSISPNGKWACGVYSDASLNTYGFRWNLEGGSIEMLSSEPSLAWDVANDGTVSGDFPDGRIRGNLPGFWRDGAWHQLEMPEGKVTDGMGYCISPDGQYMTGSVQIDGRYTPFIWKNGKLHRSLDTGKDAVAFCVSPDGNAAAGFNTLRNRAACYWPPVGDVEHFLDSPEYSYSPWNYARNFSPDGSKLLYWGGWDVDAETGTPYLWSIYDVATGKRTKVQSPAIDSDMEFFDISNNGLMVGGDRGRAYIWADGSSYVIDEYLQMRNVDLSGFEDFYNGGDFYVSQLPIFRATSVSEDEKCFALLYYNTIGEVASMILKIDQDNSVVVPAEIEASQLAGLNTVGLKWKRPVGVDNVRGYNIYRDGAKINGFLPINVPHYYDKNLAPGTYTYSVSAVTTAGVETKSEEIAVTVAEPDHAQPPYALFARQKGINGAYLSWSAPFGGSIHKHYFDIDNSDFKGFSIYMPIEVELAVRYPRVEMANYAGCKITEVTFYPMDEQDSWAVNIYSMDDDGTLTPVYSQPVTQQLRYRELNTVVLDTPVDIPAGDLVVAIDVLVHDGRESVMGAHMGIVTPGYSDLLRMKSEDGFYSAYEQSAASAMSLTCLSWSIDLGLQGDGANTSQLAHYNVYVDDVPAGTAEGTNIVLEALADGDHKVSVEAEYADGKTSGAVSANLNVKASYLPVSDVTVDTGSDESTVVKATWTAPVDCDAMDVTYTDAKTANGGIMGTSGNAYAMMAAVEFPASMLRGYEGYRVQTMRFYPLADALYTFMLYANDRLVYELEVDDFQLNQWNNVTVPDEVLIQGNATYRLVIDCFDPVPEVHVLGIDNVMPRPYQSDLYSTDNGETWGSLWEDISAPGGWLLGMTIADGQGKPVDVDGYDVVIDGEVRNTSRLTATEFDYDFGTADDAAHTLSVSVYYPALAEAVEGDATYFHISASGMLDGMIAQVRLRKGGNFLVADGDDVQSIALYSVGGSMAAKADGSRVDISALPTGVYIAKMAVGGKTVTRKVNILK